MKASFPINRRYLLVLGFLITQLTGCSRSSTQTGYEGYVSRKGTSFVDSRGNIVVPYGINVSNKNPQEGYIGDLGDQDFALIAGWGMNCIRLSIFWDAIEPEPGRIENAYLERVAVLIDKAKKHRLWVLLDMHQDLYSRKFSDGAPAWATLDGGKPFQPEKIWYDAYYSSEAVQTAEDNFWANAAAPDGVGLQEHYARAWQAVAARFSYEPAVLGYDLMNEPFPGKDGRRIQESMLQGFAEGIRRKKIDPSMTMEKLAKLINEENGRGQWLEWLRDLDLFKAMVEAPEALVQEFEHSRLEPMYARVAAKIREVDPRHLIMIEPCMETDTGIRSALQPLKDSRGQMDSEQAYAPHGYDLITDTNFFEKGNVERVALIFQRHHERALELQMPMIVGEWGAYYLNPQAVTAAQQVLSIFQGISCGSTYWSYSRELAGSPLKAVLQRKLSS